MATKKSHTFFVPGHCPSLKNTKQVGVTKDGRPFMYSHKRVKEYVNATDEIYAKKAAAFYAGYENGTDLLGEPQYTYPVAVGFHFIRADNRDFDFNNAIHIVADQMVKHQWIPDDSMKYFMPFPLYLTPKKFDFTSSWYSVYSARPGVAIRIINHI